MYMFVNFVFLKTPIQQIMELIVPTYIAFYKTLRTVLAQKIFEIDPEFTYTSESGFWDAKYPQTKKNILQDLLKSTVSPEHFKRKYEQEVKTRTEIAVKDSIFIPACEKILDLSIPKNYSRISDPAKKAVHLYFAFLTKYCTEYLEKEKARLGHYLQRDEISNAHIGDLGIVKSGNGQYHIGQSITDKGLSIVKLINSFYSYVNEKDYKGAWGLLTTDFQERVWKSSLNKFHDGYSQTIEIKHLHIFDIQESRLNSFKCKVYYEDIINIFYTPNFKKLNSLSLTDAEEFSIILADFQSRAKKLGIDKVDDIEIVKLFDNTFSEYIRVTRNISQNTISKVLPRHESIEVPRLFIISCAYIDLEWRINSIRPIKSVLLR